MNYKPYSIIFLLSPTSYISKFFMMRKGVYIEISEFFMTRKGVYIEIEKMHVLPYTCMCMGGNSWLLSNISESFVSREY